MINRKEKCGPQCFSSVCLGHSEHDSAIPKQFTWGEGDYKDLTQRYSLFSSSALYNSVTWVYNTTDGNYQTNWKVVENPSLNIFLTFYLTVIITHLFTMANTQSDEPVFHNAIGTVFHRTLYKGETHLSQLSIQKGYISFIIRMIILPFNLPYPLLSELYMSD